jgi:rhodanese-related sulfurtransferase
MSETNGATFPSVGPDEVRAHVERGDAFVLDVRRSAGKAQIYGAIRYDPKKLLAAPKLVLPLPKDDGTIVLYDERGDSQALREIAEKLDADGYGEIFLLDGGFDAWTRANGKTEERTIEQSVPLVSEHQLER